MLHPVCGWPGGYSEHQAGSRCVAKQEGAGVVPR